jgi:hypothetical protein
MAKRKRSAKAPVRVRILPTWREIASNPLPDNPRFRAELEEVRKVAEAVLTPEQREAMRRLREREMLEMLADHQQAQKPKRKRKGKLTKDQMDKGLVCLSEHPNLTPKQLYPLLRKAMKLKKAEISNTTLWRAFWRDR